MKRKILVSVCAAIVLVSALWSTSFAAVTLDGPSTVTAGSTVEFTIRSTQLGMSAIIQTEGLEFESVNGGLSNETSVLLLDDYGGMEAKYTYKVTAAANQPVSFALTEVRESDGNEDILAPTLTWSGTVGGSAITSEGPEPTPTNQPAQNPSSTNASPGATLPGAPTGSATATVPATTDNPAAAVTTDAATTPSPEPTPTDGPKTGDATMSTWIWWVIGIACAVVVVFAARKVFGARKNHNSDK